jgi:putative spermidine/putrescine transport system permease protein
MKMHPHETWRALRGYALVIPVLAMLLVTFIVPLLEVVRTSVTDDELQAALPNVAAALRPWDGQSAVPAEASQALLLDLPAAAPQKLAALGRRLSYEDPKANSLLRLTAQRLKSGATNLAEIDARWSQSGTWQMLKRAAGPYSSFYLLGAFDLRRDFVNGVKDSYETGGLYRNILLRTFLIAFLTTVCVVVLAFPLCFFISQSSAVIQRGAVLIIMLPFWTSIIVRTTAWIVLLQDRGVINQLLEASGLINGPLPLLHNRFAVIVVLTHVMLPFLALPLLASMRAVDHRLTDAAASLGAGPLRAFWSAYLPQILPGLAAGAMLVFVLTLGFYVTPALVGGPADQTIGAYIALFTTGTGNWGLASALGLVLTVSTALLLALRQTLTGFVKDRGTVDR